MSDWDSMRAADSDRQRTTDVLKAAVAEGRLTPEEYNRRLDQALTAKTYGELKQLVADLPSGPTPGFAPPTPTPGLPVVAHPWASPVPYEPQRRTNGLAKASVISGALGFATCGVGGIPAVITGHMALHRIHRSQEHGANMAIVGLVLGYLQIGFILLAVIAGIA